uniref:DOMON domain-containing protein n=1 Tax=Phytophthora ramorum TaxID=164328 RepID=H3GS19_PHYRM
MTLRALFLPLLVLATSSNMASAAVSNSDICSSTAFQALSGTRLGDSPIFVRALVQGDEVCIEYQLDASVASDATWFGVGPSRDSNMVSSPATNVMMFFKDAGVPTSYLLGGYVNSDVTAGSDQSAFVVGETSTTSMSFSYQRTLAAATTSEVALSASGATDFIWAYGTSWPISTHRSGTNGAATFNVAAASAGSSAGATSTTVGSSTSTPWCDDKNCPGIVGGIAFAVMAVCGLLLTAALKTSPVGKLLLHRTVAPPPVKLTTNAPVAKPHTMFMQTLADLHLGELLVMLIFVAAVVVLIALLSDEDNYVVSGQVSLLILMFLILPVSRLPVWSVLFGSSFERIWHPFSSIVTPDGKSLGFCIKAMGNGSFTRKLMEKAGTQYELTANLCGPFGKMSLNVDRYDAVVLVAGGVGITPMMSLINQTRLFPNAASDSDKTPKAADWYVIWSVREPEDILMMEQFLPTHAQLDYAARASIQDPNMAILGNNAPAPVNINWMFHVSNARSDGVVTRANGETLSYRGGQPVLDEVINTSRFNGRKVTVVACGPPTMTVEAQSLARNCNFDFHKEVFNW